jgi:hypothetical protein
MTEFTERATRTFCRNPKRRSKLPTPTSNEHAAFCARGCHSAYYRKHCLVCEGAILQPKRGERLICKKAACINAFRESSGTYRYLASQTAESISETPDIIDSKQVLKPDRGWFIVAGPELSPSAFHCAIVGAREAVDGYADINAAHWKAARAGDRGYRLPDAPANLSTVDKSLYWSDLATLPQITADLSIPAFLLRRPEPPQPLAMAA